jgi:hypothetical protein
MMPEHQTPKSRSATPRRTVGGSRSGTVAKVEAAYFKMVNDQAGINGRKINFISYDDG